MPKIRDERVREQDALRQEKYYELHKEEINKRRRERHAEKMKHSPLVQLTYVRKLK